MGSWLTYGACKHSGGRARGDQGQADPEAPPDPLLSRSGVILYAMVTGKLPFKERQPHKMIHVIKQGLAFRQPISPGTRGHLTPPPQVLSQRQGSSSPSAPPSQVGNDTVWTLILCLHTAALVEDRVPLAGSSLCCQRVGLGSDPQMTLVLGDPHNTRTKGTPGTAAGESKGSWPWGSGTGL